MKCPKCNGKVRVLDCVNTPDNEKYRQRICLNCGHVFYTMEFEVENTPQFKKEWNNYYRKSEK